MNDITALALLVSKAKASVFTMKYISQFEADDIDSDDVDLRFEVDGVETGTNVSIVDECGQAAQMITALIEALEKAQQQTTESENRVRKQNRHICELFDDNTALRQRIASLEESHAQVIQSRDHYKRMSEEGLKQLLESRTVTVNLPNVSDDAFWLPAYGRLVFREETYRSAVVNAICDAGIQVIEGEQKNG